MFDQNGYYDGSRTFTWLADLCGLSVDLMNFLICQITGLFLASFYRSILHPSKVSSVVRHLVALTQGLAFGYFCFGRQAIHIAGLPTACYIVIRTQNPRIVQRTVMLVAMIYLLCIHLIRQIYDYGSYALDITGPLMIITQKVTSLAFSIHDGFMHENEELSKAQQYHAVKKIPSALEYFSYMLHFQSIMAGPLVFYKDYIDFIDGYNFKRHSNVNTDNGLQNQVVLEPSPMKPVIKKLLSSLICALLFMKMTVVYPVKNMKEDDFLYNTSMLYKIWYINWSTLAVRFKYYHAWLLADAICNMSGLGFNGYNQDGNAKWDLISNISVFGFEFSTNMRDALNNWNIGTNRWLRNVVYDRVPKNYGTLLTFSLSAVWHGFYPGYYITFASGALMVTSARTARRMFRHHFQRTQFTRMFYDILTCLTTRIVLCYCVFPFVLLEFMVSAKLYLKFYYGPHVLALAIIYLLPRVMNGEARGQAQIVRNDEKMVNSTLNVIEKSSGSLGTDIGTKSSNRKNLLLATPSNGLKNRRIAVNSNNKETDYVNIPHTDLNEQLSNKFEIEKKKNIEEFIDKTVNETVNGIVGFKRELMRDCSALPQIDNNKMTSTKQQQQQQQNYEEVGSTVYLKKEINAINDVVKQANNMFPVVLSNGHAK